MQAETESDFVNQLLYEGRQRYPKDHLWTTIFLNGELSKEQLQKWAINRYYFHNSIPNKDAAILSKLPKDARTLWIEKLGEEAGDSGHPSHPDLWIRFCEDLGLSRNDVIDGEVYAPVKITVDAYTYGARNEDWRWGAGASLTEFTVPAKMEKYIKAFNEHYSYITEEGRFFFDEHAEADERHGKIIIDILNNYSENDVYKEEFRKGYFFKLDLHRVMLDSIHYETVLKK